MAKPKPKSSPKRLPKPAAPSIAKSTAKCSAPDCAALPVDTLKDGAVPDYTRSNAELAEVEAFKRRYAGYERLAPAKATLTGNVLTVSFDHPDQALVGTRIANTLASPDPALTDGLLMQISQLASNRAGDLDTKAMDFMLAAVKGIAPQDPIETLLAVQMPAVHNATITAANQLRNSEFVDTLDHALQAMNKLARTFALQIETLKKHRSTGEQTVRVQHVTVNDGGHAIVAENVVAGGRGHQQKGQSTS